MTPFALGLIALALVLGLQGQTDALQGAVRLFDAPEIVIAHDDAPALLPSVYDLAIAISIAEGYGVSGAIPTRANNPGDLALGDQGSGTLGSAKITVFQTAADGWAALYRQLSLIVTGRSRVYTPGDTVRSMAEKWTGGDAADAWAANVVRVLTLRGYPVDVSMTIGDTLNA